MQQPLKVICSLALAICLASTPSATKLAAQDSPANNKDPKSRHWLMPIPEVDPDPAIPTSEQALRYHWADDISSHHQIEVYLKALALAAPDRTRLVQYGRSYEGRSLNYLVISSAENIARLDEIRQNNLMLADPRKTDSEQAKALIESQPAVVWLAYAVHGNEISPSDAAILTAYHLLADRRAETQQMLKDLVVIIDPLQNPDGRDRFVNVFRETRGAFFQSYPVANEHTERWPGGRSNHYWFDMNRDWFRHSQQEVKAKVAAYLQWQPQIYVDAHEMGANSTFYFPPPSEPKNPFLLDHQHQWFNKLGTHNAEWFDEYGFGYMTREVFDAFYPGYGSEWPTLQGGLGVLWEQASARGMIVERDDETELTYHDGVRHHYIAGVSTVEFMAANRKEMLEGFYRSKLRSVELGTEGETKHYFLTGRHSPQRTRRLVSLLRRNGVEVGILKESIQVNCSNIRGGDESIRTIPAGSFHIDVGQPTGRLIRALLDRSVEMDDKFLRRQLERNDLRLPDEIYDVTAWSLPLAFDVQCLISSETVDVPSELWWNFPKQFEPVEPAKVAYLVPGTDGAIRAMSDWLQDGVRVHVMDEGFRLGGRDYDPGTIIVKVSENGEDLHAKMQATQETHDIEIIGTDTAYVESGAHMGGPHVNWVRPPEILLVVKNPTRYSSGHTWHLFDQVLNYPTTRVNGDNFGRVNLSRFNTLILPDGSYTSDGGFGESAGRRIGQWVRDGGTLILMRGATRWATSEDVGLIENKVVNRKIDSQEEGEKPIEVTPDSVPGAFFRANVFQRHWVTYHYRSDFDVFYTGNLVLSPTLETQGRSLVSFSSRDQLLSSGFCWPNSMDLLADSPYVVYRSMGRGHVIAFTDDPNFRAMYPSLQRLFINAAMFGAGH